MLSYTELSRLKEWLGQFSGECYKLKRVFDEMDEDDLNDIISDEYPFPLSFDEMVQEVRNWYQSVKAKVDQAFEEKQARNRFNQRESVKKNSRKLSISEEYFKNTKYQLVDADTDDVIEVFDNEDKARAFADKYSNRYS